MSHANVLPMFWQTVDVLREQTRWIHRNVFKGVGCWIAGASAAWFVMVCCDFHGLYFWWMTFVVLQVLLAHRWRQCISVFIWHTVYWFNQTQPPFSSFDNPDVLLVCHGWLLASSASTHDRDFLTQRVSPGYTSILFPWQLMDHIRRPSLSTLPLWVDWPGSRHIATQDIHIWPISASSLMADGCRSMSVSFLAIFSPSASTSHPGLWLFDTLIHISLFSYQTTDLVGFH